MIKLTNWILNNPLPAFNDLESVTVLEAVHKLYGATNELIDEYNKFNADITKTVNEFKSSTDKDIELFEMEMRQHFQEFTDVIELKLMDYESLSANIDSIVTGIVNSQVGNLNERIAAQDKKIDDTAKAMDENIVETVNDIIADKFAAGEVTVNAEDVQARNNIAAINQAMEELQNEVSSLNTSGERFTAIETKNIQQDAYIEDLEEAFSEQGVKITNHENRLAVTENNIVTLQEELNGVDEALNTILGV